MAELKTQETDASVDAFIDSVADEKKRADARKVLALMQRLSGEEARMWGKALVGFGHYKYKYASGHAGEWFRVGFSPRKANLTLYVMPGFSKYDELLGRLGKHKIGKSCLYIKRLSDVDEAVLEELVRSSIEHMAEKYPE